MGAVLYLGDDLKRHNEGVRKWDRKQRKPLNGCVNEQITPGATGAQSHWDASARMCREPFRLPTQRARKLNIYLRAHHLRVALWMLALQWAWLTPQAREQPYTEKHRTPTCVQKLSSGELKGGSMRYEWHTSQIHCDFFQHHDPQSSVERLFLRL